MTGPPKLGHPHRAPNTGAID